MINPSKEENRTLAVEQKGSRDRKMLERIVKKERGFTALEIAVVVMLVGVLLAFATPKITAAMREYRLNIAARQMVGLINRAKMSAVSDNKKTSIAVDITGNRAGLVIYKDDGTTVDHIEFIPLPQGITFQKPAGVSAVPPGVTTTGLVSFSLKNGYYMQDFTSRGFPVVASGPDVVSIFFGNSKSYEAITITSVGGITTYRLEKGAWVNAQF